MRHYIIASHHLLAEGMKDTLTFLTSMTEHVHAIAAYMDDGVQIEDQIQEIFDQVHPEDEVIIMTDMVSGSVNQKLFPRMGEHVHLISGVSLPAAMGLLFLPADRYVTAEDIHTVLDEARTQLVYVNECSSEDDEE